MLGSRHVVLRCANSLLVAGVLTWSTASLALGLGDITVHSALNQPLKADIALVDVGGVSESELAVRLASADEFGRAGIERVFFLNDLKFTPILRANRNMIRVTSTKPVNEPFLNFLVQLDQPNGHLLREYTVLIDPPGSPGIVPATDEPTARAQSSEFPTPEAPTATTPAKPAAPVQPPAPVAAAQAEQLAASLVQNQQLQKTIDALNVKLQAQEVLIADGKKQLGDLQARLIEVQQAPPVTAAPVAPVPAPVIAPVEAQEDSLNWPLLGGLLLVLGLLVAGLYVRRQRQQAQGTAAPLPFLPVRNEPPVDDAEPMQSSAIHSAVEHREEHANGDVLEAVGIYLAYGRLGEAAGLLRDALQREPERIDLGVQLLEVLGRQGDTPIYDEQENRLRQLGVEDQRLQEIRARYPKLASAAPLAAAAPVIAALPIEPPVEPEPEDNFELNLDQLSMASSWDLEETRSTTDVPEQAPSTLGSDLQVLPQDFELPETLPDDTETAELEWIAEPEAQPLDEDFLNEFGDPGMSLSLEPLELQAPEPEPEPEPSDAANAGKLEQAQTCIDDGDLDSAIALLNELLKEADEPLKQTARTLLAGIR
ncbi:FimV/HubP family polar landmark protein [Pseudomonas sp. 3-2]|uniref:FimV/HubP family polar landmark protein n=1 Tax=Pseudomonas sp. 3-2 TaxID=2867408 RepID=UPI001C886DAB|nr:FimV/HubP family polar landmark protein [Pseudomonas sp. 3-2]QZD72723.1 peptidoglycan-binding protein LysM [Pseudomonas sp. 3-2]